MALLKVVIMVVIMRVGMGVGLLPSPPRFPAGSGFTFYVWAEHKMRKCPETAFSKTLHFY